MSQKRGNLRQLLKTLREIELEIADGTRIGNYMNNWAEKRFPNVDKPNRNQVEQYVAEYIRVKKEGLPTSD